MDISSCEATGAIISTSAIAAPNSASLLRLVHLIPIASFRVYFTLIIR